MLVTTAIAAAALIWALRWAPWRRFADSSFQHVFLGGCVAVLLLWALRVPVGPGIDIHLLGITTLTLMFGWQFATVAAAAICMSLPLAGQAAWPELPATFLAEGVVPVVVTWAIYRFSLRRLPHNIFVYIFVCAFFGAALASAAAALSQALLEGLGGTGDGAEAALDALKVLPLYAFPEAFINGFVMTGLVVTRPQWVASFDDAVYLHGK